MTKKEREELYGILNGISAELTQIKSAQVTLAGEMKEIKKNQIILNSRADTFEESFRGANRAVTNLGLALGETQRQVHQIHAHVISTTDRIGKRVRKLELVKNNGEPSSGGRRPARKNS